MGSILGCRDAALAMAAGMSIGRSPFLRVNTQRKWPPRNGEEQKSSMEDMKQERILVERSELFRSVGASDHGTYLSLSRHFRLVCLHMCLNIY